MSILFSPSGPLNINDDATELPQQADGKNISSGAVVKCKNLHMDKIGIAKTRDGSAKVNASAIDTDIDIILIQGSDRYVFSGDKIYQNESSIATGLTAAAWSAILYNQYNDTTQQVYALNGTDRKRIEDTTVYEWGLTAPSAPTAGRQVMDFTLSDYFQWTASGSGTNEYYLQNAGGGNPSLSSGYHSQPVNVIESTTDMTAGTAGSLAAGEWDWADNDSLGYSTVYVRLSTNDDPDTYTDTYPGGKHVLGTISGSKTGVYQYKITQIRTVGSTVVEESNPSDASSVTCVGEATYIVLNELNLESGATGYRVYRTSAGGSIFQLLTETYMTEVTLTTDYSKVKFTGYSWLDIGVDGATTNTVETDHDRPPLGSKVFGPMFDGTCFIIKDNLLYFSKAKQPDYWPTTNYVECGPSQYPLKTGIIYNGQFHALSQNEIYYIQGSGSTTFFPIPLKAKTGVASVNGVASARGKGIFHVAKDGIYLFSGTDIKWSKRYIDPIFRGESVNDIPAISSITNSWLFIHKNKLYFGYTSTGNTDPTNVLVFDLDVDGKIYYYNYNDLGVRCISYDETNERILVGGDDGYVWEIEKTSATDDAGTAISWEIQSKEYTLPTRAHFPRWVKYDIDASSSSACTGSILLDGTTLTSHNISGNRDTTRRLVDQDNGQRCSLNVSGSGVVSIYTIESE